MGRRQPEGGPMPMPKPTAPTPASLVTYAGASGSTMIAWTLAKALGVESRWWAVVIALVFAVGMQVFSEPLKLTGAKKYVGYAVLVFANVVVLASSALGINEAINPPGG